MHNDRLYFRIILTYKGYTRYKYIQEKVLDGKRLPFLSSLLLSSQFLHTYIHMCSKQGWAEKLISLKQKR